MNLFKKTSQLVSYFGLELDNPDEEISSEESLEKEEMETQSGKSSYDDEFMEEKQPSYSNQSSSNQSSSNQYVNKKVVDMNTYQNVGERFRQPENKVVYPRVSVFEPRAYSDCKGMAQALFRKEIVIITFATMEEFQARRVVDFMTGAIYAIDGDIQRIGEEIFICTPASVDVDSTVAQSLISAHLSNY